MFKTVLIPIDFSQKMSHFTEVLKKISFEKIILLNVIENIEMSLYKDLYLAMTSSKLSTSKSHFKNTPIYVRNQERLIEYKNRLIHKGYPVKEFIEQGVPYKKILSTAKRNDVNLILIPAYGKRLSLVKDVFLLGGTVNRIVRHSEIPVLVIK